MSEGERLAVWLRRRGILDERVLRAMAAVPRELFVPEPERRRAYADRALPIGHGQTISQPFMVATICALLRLQGHERVLDVGTGSGYQAAVLAELAAEVVTIERVPELAEQARRTLARAGYDRVEVRDRRRDARRARARAVRRGSPSRPPRRPFPMRCTTSSAEGGRLVAAGREPPRPAAAAGRPRPARARGRGVGAVPVRPAGRRERFGSIRRA